MYNRDIFSNFYFSKLRYGRARTEVKRKNAGRAGREGGREKKICLLPSPPPSPFPSFSRLTSAQLSWGRISYYKSHKQTTQKTPGSKLDKLGLQLGRQRISLVVLGTSQRGSLHQESTRLLYTTALLRYNSCHWLIRDHVALKELRHGFCVLKTLFVCCTVSNSWI